MKKLIFICLCTGYLNSSLAEVSLVKKELEEKKQAVRETKKKIITHLKKPETISQYQVEGYADSQYVRFVVDVANKKIVNGLKIESDGNSTYVYGELVDGVLHLYEPDGRHLTVVVAE